MEKNFKAQAAMEYLMTYGWAILIVVIVAAALFALGVFNPATYTGTRATGFANLGAPSEWRITDAGSFDIVVKNGLGQQITITNITATIGATIATETGLTTTVSSGSTASFTGVGTGTDFSALNIGDAYSATVAIAYTVAGGTFSRIDTGTVSGSVVA